MEKAEILAAAEELGRVGGLSVADRLRRELGAEKLFAERFASLFEELSEADRQKIPGSLLIELAKESCESGYPESSVSPLEILESPSFRDYLGQLIAQRRSDYKSAGKWPERIGNALLGKRKAGAPPRLEDLLLDQSDLDEAEALRDALRRADKEITKKLVDEKEIERERISRGFTLKAPRPPGPRPLPAGFLEQWTDAFNGRYLPQLARQLSQFRREPRRGRPSYAKQAMKWMRENRQNRAPKKLKTLQRRRARRRGRIKKTQPN